MDRSVPLVPSVPRFLRERREKEDVHGIIPYFPSFDCPCAVETRRSIQRFWFRTWSEVKPCVCNLLPSCISTQPTSNEKGRWDARPWKKESPRPPRVSTQACNSPLERSRPSHPSDDPPHSPQTSHSIAQQGKSHSLLPPPRRPKPVPVPTMYL